MNYLVPALFSALGWGLMPLFDRFCLRYINTLTLIGYKGFVYIICSLLILFFGYRSKQINIKEGYSKGGFKLVLAIIMGTVVTYLVGNLLYYKSIELSRSSLLTITLITFCLPVVVVTILAPCIYGDKLNLKMILGIFISLLGISITVIYNPNYKRPQIFKSLF